MKQEHMALSALFAILVALLLISCALTPTPRIIKETVEITKIIQRIRILTATPRASPTPYPTYTPNPTHTPYPTYTPSPTYTPIPTATSTPLPPVLTKQQLSTLLPDGLEPFRQASGDVNSDGVPDVVVLTGYPWEALGYEYLELFVLEAGAEGYKVRWSSGKLPTNGGELLQVQDINADGRLEILSRQVMGASGCTLYVFAWLGHEYAILRPRGGTFGGQDSFGRVGARLADFDGDGVWEIHASYKLDDASLMTDVYKWDGQHYVYIATQRP